MLDFLYNMEILLEILLVITVSSITQGTEVVRYNNRVRLVKFVVA